MLGRFIRVRVTHPIHSVNKHTGVTYKLNYGVVEGVKRFDDKIEGAYIMGVDNPVRSFDGRVIAYLHRRNDERIHLVVAPGNMRFIDNEIKQALSFAEAEQSYSLECLYENSCGAVVFRQINGEIRFLLIRNKRSAHWGFPKGHMEPGETKEDTATREVFEEAGIHIEILPEFALESDYTIQNRVEKNVTIFLAFTRDTNTVIQREEIDDYLWLGFQKALELLRYDNDRAILHKAMHYLEQRKTDFFASKS